MVAELHYIQLSIYGASWTLRRRRVSLFAGCVSGSVALFFLGYHVYVGDSLNFPIIATVVIACGIAIWLLLRLGRPRQKGGF